jgi:hypothetical protein
MDSYTEITSEIDIEDECEYSIKIDIQNVLNRYQGQYNRQTNRIISKIIYLDYLTGPYKFIGKNLFELDMYYPREVHMFQNEINPEITLCILISENNNTHLVFGKKDITNLNTHLDDYSNPIELCNITCNIIKHCNNEYILK